MGLEIEFMRVVMATLLLVLGLFKLMAAIGLLVSTLLDTGEQTAMDGAVLESVGLRVLDDAPLLEALTARSIVLEPSLAYMGLAMLWALSAPLFLAGGFAAMRCKRRGVLVFTGLVVLLLDGLSYGLGVFGWLNAVALASGLLALNLAAHIRPGLGLDFALGTVRNDNKGSGSDELEGMAAAGVTQDVRGKAGGERVGIVQSERYVQQRDWLDRVLVWVSVLGLFALLGMVAKRWVF